MTLPRQFIENKTYFISRRTTQRQFLLKPTPKTTEIFLYCIACAALRTGVQVHAVCVMSNHWHAVVTDPGTNIASFYAFVHKYVAKAVNASYGRWENLWSSEKTSVILLKSEEDVLDKIRYIACNPVEAGLVANPDNWPGVNMYKPGQSKTVKRPDTYFKEDGVMPKTATLTIETPPVLKKIRPKLLLKELAETIKTAVLKIQDTMRKEGRRFMGVKEVLKQKYYQSPRTQAPHQNINPRVACKNKWARIEALARNRAFLTEYYKALAIWKKTKDPKTVFPAGTYAMRIYNGVTCSPG